MPPAPAFAAAAVPPLATAIPAVVAMPIKPLPPAPPPVTSIEAISPILRLASIPAMKKGTTASIHKPTSMRLLKFRLAWPMLVMKAIPTAENTRNTAPAITA